MKITEELKIKDSIDSRHLAHINILYTAGVVYNRILQLLKPFNLTPEQFNVLRIINGNEPNPISIKEISSRMIDKSSNVSRILDRLEIKLMVERKKSFYDKRAASIILTPLGQSIINDVSKELNPALQTLVNLSQSEAIQLNQLLDKVNDLTQ